MADLIIRKLDINGWPLVLVSDAGRDEPHIEDEELARRLCYAEPRMIRKIIKRYEKSGDLAGINVRSTVTRTSMPHGGTREVEVQVYLLNEEQACFIAAKSETPAANALLREMIHVFVLARHGMLPQQGLSETRVIELVQTTMAQALTAISQQMAVLIEAVSRGTTGPVPCPVGQIVAKEIRDRLNGIAKVLAHAHKTNLTSERNIKSDSLRKTVNHHVDWAQLDERSLPLVRRLLSDWERDAFRTEVLAEPEAVADKARERENYSAFMQDPKTLS